MRDTVAGDSPLVTVGLLCYNRPEGLRVALECLTGQTYRNLEIVVSNNASPDERVHTVANEFAARDARIKYFRQEKNIGAAANFAFVLAQATAEYFMWMADDDRCDPEFIEECMRLFAKHPEAGMATTVHHFLFPDGGTARELFPIGLIAGPPSWKKVAFRTLMPENIAGAWEYYSLYRTRVVRSRFMARGFRRDQIAADISFLIGVYAAETVAVSPRVLFTGYARPGDPRKVFSLWNRHPTQFTSFLKYPYYFTNNLCQTAGTRYYGIVWACMVFRVVEQVLASVWRVLMVSILGPFRCVGYLINGLCRLGYIICEERGSLQAATHPTYGRLIQALGKALFGLPKWVVEHSRLGGCWRDAAVGPFAAPDEVSKLAD